MGDIADGILNGDFDEETGEYIGEGMGFPRSPQREKRDSEILSPRDIFKAEYGVFNWLKKIKGY